MEDVDENKLIEAFSKGLKEDPLEPIFWLQRELNKIFGAKNQNLGGCDGKNIRNLF